MAYLAKREFEILELSGEKFFQWRVDAIIHLVAKGLEKTIEKVEKKDKSEVVEVKECTPIEKAQAIAFLRHHI
ncbi:hypothetical protein, partial [Arachidicoccus sp.]|uniref:hypothetical protein n=1 Tax=Arachidicoccus sp. TaxID=1872624 RepID=UPI003D233F16